VRSFTATYPTGLAVAPAQTLSPGTSSFTAPAGDPRADSLTVTVHYTAGGAERTVSRTTPLG
jgi:hypothetical protein